jgi:hypothetical protein
MFAEKNSQNHKKNMKEINPVSHELKAKKVFFETTS